MAIIHNFDKATKTLTMEFTNITSLVEYLKHTQTNECFSHIAEGSHSSHKRGSWSGTNTYYDALQFLEFGWTAKSERLAEKLKIAKLNAPTVARRKATPSVVGYVPIVPNYLAGIPLNMLDSKITKIKQKVVTINKDISYHAGYSENQIEDNSVKAFQIIQALEASGIRCNLNVILGVDFSYRGKNVKQMIVKVRVKGSGEKLNISKTSFGLVNPGMLRRIMFRLIETAPEFKAADRGICFGYGSPISGSTLKANCESNNQYYLSRDIRDAEQEAKNFCK